jgi:hypothetical protein
VRSARLLTPLDLSKGIFLFLSVCASVGYRASSLRSLGHVVVTVVVVVYVPPHFEIPWEKSSLKKNNLKPFVVSSMRRYVRGGNLRTPALSLAGVGSFVASRVSKKHNIRKNGGSSHVFRKKKKE